MAQQKRGVCCECQSVGPVRSAGIIDPSDEELEELGEVGRWMMASHDAWGQYCTGTGTMPQAILKD